MQVQKVGSRNISHKGSVDKSVVRLINNITTDIKKDYHECDPDLVKQSAEQAQQTLESLNKFMAQCGDNIKLKFGYYKFFSIFKYFQGFLFKNKENGKVLKGSKAPIFPECPYIHQTSDNFINEKENEIEIASPQIPFPRLTRKEDYGIIRFLKESIDYMVYGPNGYEPNSILRVALLDLFPKKTVEIRYDQFDLKAISDYTKALTTKVKPSDIDKALK